MIKSRRYDGKLRKLFRRYCFMCARVLWLPRKCTRKPRQYCSHKCASNYLTQKGRVQRICSFCDSKFQIKRSSLGNSKSGYRFCRRACKDKAQRIGGISAIQPKHYGSGSSNFAYRSRGLRHYGARCQRCGYDRMRQMLDVHHRDSNHADSSIKNLEVLCVWCHAMQTRKVVPHRWVGQIKI